jgi:hypothetical protein
MNDRDDNGEVHAPLAMDSWPGSVQCAHFPLESLIAVRFSQTSMKMPTT